MTKDRSECASAVKASEKCSIITYRKSSFEYELSNVLRINRIRLPLSPPKGGSETRYAYTLLFYEFRFQT